MGDLKLFRLKGTNVEEVPGEGYAIEKSLQTLIEGQMETFLGVRFLASEYSTGQVHRGRIDSLGIDENHNPVIIEYKRSTNENVINQGLFYLNWLLDHRGDFEVLLTKKLGAKAADEIDWSNPRLICIAGDFTRYDREAISQINRNIQLIRYRKYADDLLVFEMDEAYTAESPSEPRKRTSASSTSQATASDHYERSDQGTKDLFEAVKSYCMGLGDDVQLNAQKQYFAFKRIKNFACVEPHPNKKTVVVFVKVNPTTVKLEDGFTRDVSEIGHYGTGDLEITLRSQADLRKAQDLIRQSYEAS